MIIISRNLLLKLGWQINAANYIKNQDDIQVVLHTVMFRGTPCNFKWHLFKKRNHAQLETEALKFLSDYTFIIAEVPGVARGKIIKNVEKIFILA